MLTNYANNLIKSQLINNRNKLSAARISTIHPEIFLKYSSVNVFLGKQGSGKTFALNKELVKISLIDSDVHMIVIASKDGRKDETFETFREQINLPIITVNYENIVEYLNDLIFHKMIYDYIRDNDLSEQIESAQAEEVLEFLKLEDFNRNSLQEVIVFDDAAYQAILTKNNSQIIPMIHQARHYKLIFCFCVQGVKAIPLPIKEQMTNLFLFPGFINQKLTTIFQQSGITCIEYDDFKQIYRQLHPREFILVDCQKGNIEIINGEI